MKPLKYMICTILALGLLGFAVEASAGCGGCSFDVDKTEDYDCVEVLDGDFACIKYRGKKGGYKIVGSCTIVGEDPDEIFCCTIGDPLVKCRLPKRKRPKPPKK